MAAKYDFREAPNPQERDGSGILYPKLVSKGTVSWKQMVKEVADNTSFDEGTVVGVMHEVERLALWHMSDGFRVQVGSMCYAEPTVELTDSDRKLSDESEIHAQSVRFGKVNLQPAKRFRPQGKLERADKMRKFGHSSTRFTETERYDLLSAYLEEHGVISRTDYSRLTGLLRSSAQRELNAWIAEGRLACSGSAPHRVYHLPKRG